jgi:uncharacterized repeat protein (TIGR04052 family)
MMRWTALLIALALASCGKSANQAITIRFQAVADGKPLTCTTGPEGRTLGDLRFFVHDVALLTADGKVIPVTLDSAPPWQSAQVVLVDLEDGQGGCDTGSPMMHAAVTGHAPAGAYSGLRFTLGVPFALNHADPAVAEPPLDQTVMHWHWNAGYKFLRAEIVQGTQKIALHLGSTGCEGHIGAITRCAEPNRPVMTIAAFDAAKDSVAIDLGALFKDARAGMCQSEPDNASCAPMLRHLGLAEGAAQDVFHAIRP